MDYFFGTGSGVKPEDVVCDRGEVVDVFEDENDWLQALVRKASTHAVERWLLGQDGNGRWTIARMQVWAGKEEVERWDREKEDRDRKLAASRERWGEPHEPVEDR